MILENVTALGIEAVSFCKRSNAKDKAESLARRETPKILPIIEFFLSTLQNKSLKTNSNGIRQNISFRNGIE